MKSIIVAAIDNSAAAGPVLEIAGAFARSVGGDLQALHVAEDGDDTAGALATAQGTSLRTVPGDVVECLVDAAEAPGVIAIVLGGRGRPGGPRPAGHIAKEVITRVRIPVVVVPPDAARPTRLERVLVPMEGLPGEAGALAPVLELLASSGVKVAAVHVDDEASLPSYSDQVQHETEAFTREFVAAVPPPHERRRACASRRETRTGGARCVCGDHAGPGRGRVVAAICRPVGHGSSGSCWSAAASPCCWCRSVCDRSAVVTWKFDRVDRRGPRPSRFVLAPLDLASDVGLGDRPAEEDVPRVERQPDPPAKQHPRRPEVPGAGYRPDPDQHRVDEEIGNDMSREVAPLSRAASEPASGVRHRLYPWCTSSAVEFGGACPSAKETTST